MISQEGREARAPLIRRVLGEPHRVTTDGSPRILTQGLPTIARPMRAYYLLSEVAVASRPATRGASQWFGRGTSNLARQCDVLAFGSG
jgi:hypothetical protein